MQRAGTTGVHAYVVMCRYHAERLRFENSPDASDGGGGHNDAIASCCLQIAAGLCLQIVCFCKRTLCRPSCNLLASFVCWRCCWRQAVPLLTITIASMGSRPFASTLWHQTPHVAASMPLPRTPGCQQNATVSALAALWPGARSRKQMGSMCVFGQRQAPCLCADVLYDVPAKQESNAWIVIHAADCDNWTGELGDYFSEAAGTNLFGLRQCVGLDPQVCTLNRFEHSCQCQCCRHCCSPSSTGKRGLHV